MNSVIIGLTVPFLGTLLGAAFVFLMRDGMSTLTQKALLGFASGVMIAASVWSLIIPGLEMCSDMEKWAVAPVAAGFAAGMATLLAIDRLTPHLHIGAHEPEGPRSRLSRTTMLSLAVTIHNLPEGMAVGVVVVGAMSGGTGLAPAAVLAVALGIAIQNIPEGAIVSMPLRAEGNSRLKSFAIGTLSGAVEPVGAALVILLAPVLMPVLPALLAFAAGAMMYVVVEELIPETSVGAHSNIGVTGFALGFVLMMSLDVVLG